MHRTYIERRFWLIYVEQTCIFATAFQFRLAKLRFLAHKAKKCAHVFFFVLI